MTNIAAEPLRSRELAPSGNSTKSLIAIVMLVATILGGLFDAGALVTVLQGPVAYQGVDFATRGSEVVVSNVTDPGLYRQGVRPGQRVVWQGRSAWRAAWPRPGDTIHVESPSGAVAVRASHAPFGHAFAAIALAMIFVAMSVLVFAGVLCYQRPGVMTVAFWLFVAANFNVAWLMTSTRRVQKSWLVPLSFLSTQCWADGAITRSYGLHSGFPTIGFIAEGCAMRTIFGRSLASLR